jgi:hypothetical protein
LIRLHQGLKSDAVSGGDLRQRFPWLDDMDWRLSKKRRCVHGQAEHHQEREQSDWGI